MVGSPVGHSLSPVLHQAAYQALGLRGWRYEALETSAAELPGLVRRLSSPVPAGAAVPVGLSVTMPHKQTLLPLLDAVDPLAEVVGAVNTVVAQRAGRGEALLTGFNTDVAGISQAFRRTATLPVAGARAVVLGAGATACSALAALTELGATSLTVAARRLSGPGRVLAAAHRMGLELSTLTWLPGEPGAQAALCAALAEADLVVSTLPAGTADPLARQLEAGGSLRPGAVLLDVVYDPWPTALATTWQRRGGLVAPGWLMLLHQAVAQVGLMTGREAPVAEMDAALQTALARRG